MQSSTCFLLVLQVPFCYGVACTLPYKNIRGVCIHYPNLKTNYCDAQKYCTTIKGELVTGDGYLPLAGKKFPGIPYYYWIGLTDFINERGAKKSGWRWTNGNEAPLSSSLPWANNEPGNVGPISDCVVQVYKSGMIGDNGCIPLLKWMGVPMCQPRPQPSSSAREGKFKETNIPVGLTPYDYANNGCWQTKTQVKSKIECAAVCLGELNGLCVAFYFSEALEKCRLVLYTDANINIGDYRGWIKMSLQ